MSLRTFTDNVIILAVENCLVSKLRSLLTTSMVHEMDEETLSRLAAESSSVRENRRSIQKDIEVLTEGLRICTMYKPRDLTSESPPSIFALFGLLTLRTLQLFRQQTLLPRPQLEQLCVQRHQPDCFRELRRRSLHQPAASLRKPPLQVVIGCFLPNSS